MSQHKEPQGFVTFAQNTADVDYLELAYIQALNIKATQRINRCAIIVDLSTRELMQQRHYRAFDHVIDLPADFNTANSTWKLANESQVFWLTPFKETIKLESDLLFTRNIDHWWTAFRLRDVCMSSGCRNYQQQLSYSRRYRQMFDDNQWPDVYNGLMYFRFSKTAHKFFTVAQQLQSNWHTVRDCLKNCREDSPSTDVLYALTAQIIGPELCTMPSLDFINFVHMKPAINGLEETAKFTKEFVVEFDSGMIRINNINQLQPLHYHEKDFVTPQIKEWYESRNH
jgi:hypothetical protein